jgi:hypothetical protein
VREIAAVLAWLHALIDGRRRRRRSARQRAAAGAGAPPRRRRSGDDFARVNDAAMQNLGAWVPALLPAARAYKTAIA